MYVITEQESYEYEYPIAVSNTIDDAKNKATDFLKSRSVMIDYFNIYEIREKIEEYPSYIISLGRDGTFKYKKGNK